MEQTNHTPTHFVEELAELKQALLAMGGKAEERVSLAIQGLVQRDAEMILDAKTGDEALNRAQLEIDDRAFKLLALHQPMAVDLRFIVGSVKINADLERVGDLAVNIAEAAERYIRHPSVKSLIDLPRMAELAQRMLRDALDSFVRQDLALAQLVLGRDDELDALKNQVFRELLGHMLADPRTIEPGLDLILVSRHLERIGDHATNIAEDVIFIFAARDVRHQGQDQSVPT
jgi:phosphate transport system protein